MIGVKKVGIIDKDTKNKIRERVDTANIDDVPDMIDRLGEQMQYMKVHLKRTETSWKLHIKYLEERKKREAKE